MPSKGWTNHINWWSNDLSALAHLAPVFVFAFTCHQNIFAIHNELNDNSIKRVASVIGGSIGSAFWVYTLIGVFGYLSFGDGAGDNIITMYPKSWVITGGQICIAILVALSYPLQCHPCRTSLDKVVDGIMCVDSVDEPPSNLKHNAMTIGILICSWIVAITVSDLSTILGFVGATGSTTICYILPGLLYWKVGDNAVLRWIGMFLSGFGVVFMIVCVSVQVRH